MVRLKHGVSTSSKRKKEENGVLKAVCKKSPETQDRKEEIEME